MSKNHHNMVVYGALMILLLQSNSLLRTPNVVGESGNEKSWVSWRFGIGKLQPRCAVIRIQRP